MQAFALSCAVDGKRLDATCHLPQLPKIILWGFPWREGHAPHVVAEHGRIDSVRLRALHLRATVVLDDAWVRAPLPRCRWRRARQGRGRCYTPRCPQRRPAPNSPSCIANRSAPRARLARWRTADARQERAQNDLFKLAGDVDPISTDIDSCVERVLLHRTGVFG